MEIVQEKNIVQDIAEAAKEICVDLLPEKSKVFYLKAYDTFMAWKVEKQIGADNFSEDVMLVYFNEQMKIYKPSTIWNRYSMLRTTIERNNNVNIEYPKLVSLLKKNGVGFEAKKSKVFEPDEVRRFLTEGDDHHYLAAKVIMIFGVYGATRTSELVSLKMKDVKRQGEVFVVKIEQTKTYIKRSFTVEDEYSGIVRKYINLRAAETTHDRFFVNYQKGRCTKQPIGKHKFSAIPKMIANILGLHDSEEYTGHSFRRTSATILADAGGDILLLKRHGGWQSSTVAEGYVNDSKRIKRKIGGIISSAIMSEPTTSVVLPSENAKNALTSTMTSSNQMVSRQIAISANSSTSILTQSNFVNIDNHGVAAENAMKTIQVEKCSHFTINFNFGKTSQESED